MMTPDDWDEDTLEPRRRERYKKPLILLALAVALGLVVLFMRTDFLGYVWPSTPKAKAVPTEFPKKESPVLNGLPKANTSKPVPTSSPEPGNGTHPAPNDDVLKQLQTSQTQVLALLHAQTAGITKLAEGIQDLMKKQLTPQTTEKKTTPKETAQQREQRQKEALRAEEERQRKLKEWKPKSWDVQSSKDKDKDASAKWTQLGPYSVFPGRPFPCETYDAMTSQAPGIVTVYLREPMRDSRTGEYILAIQGSSFVLKPAGGQVHGTGRQSAQVLSLTLPNGKSIKLANAHAGDAEGKAGFADQVDNRWLGKFASIALLGVLRSGTGLMAGGYGGDTGVAERLGAGVASETARSGSEQVRQTIDTSTIFNTRKGYLCSISFENALEFEGPYVH